MSESEAMQAADGADFDAETTDNGEAINDDAVAEQAEGPSESSTDSGENHENKITFTDEQQRVINDLAAKKTFKIKEAEREAERLRRELEEARAKLPQETRPDIPPIPDPYDDDYEARLKERDEALRRATEYDLRQQVIQQQQQAAQQQKLQQEQEALVARATAYSENAAKKGIKPDQLQAAGGVVAQFGLRDDVASEMLADADGPLMTVYLASNPQAIEELNSAGPVQLGSIYAKVKQAAAGVAPKSTSAPEPSDPLKGSGVIPRERGPKGATFE